MAGVSVRRSGGWRRGGAAATVVGALVLGAAPLSSAGAGTAPSVAASGAPRPHTMAHAAARDGDGQGVDPGGVARIEDPTGRRPGRTGTWDDHPTASRDLGDLPCRELLFVGVRGSAEQVPWGNTVNRAREGLAERLLDRSVNQVWLEYPAVDPHTLRTADLEGAVLEATPRASRYFASVDAGSAELTRVLGASARECPGQQVVVVGFSQGAQVITRALAGGADSSTLAGALLLGNPAHHPGQNVREVGGQLDTPAIGLAATLTYLRSRARPQEATTRRQAVHNLVSEVFALHRGEVSNSAIAATLEAGGDVIAPGEYSRVLSICSTGDVVCDAAPAMSRVLTSATGLEDEFATARPIHGGYAGEVLHPGIEALVDLTAPDDAPGDALGDAAGRPRDGGEGTHQGVREGTHERAHGGVDGAPHGAGGTDPADPADPADPGAAHDPDGGAARGDGPAASGDGTTPGDLAAGTGREGGSPWAETGPSAWVLPTVSVAAGVFFLTSCGLGLALWRRR